jgi:hypothetical protein
MNANKNASERLKRIEDVSRIVRFAVLALLVLSVGDSLLTLFWLAPQWVEQQPLQAALGVLMQLVLWAWYWNLADLFHLYQRGLIFARQTIRCIKLLGLLCVIYGLFTSAWRAANYLFPAPHSRMVPPGVLITFHKSYIITGLFSFTLNGFNVGLLLAGIIIVIIAWIMDEGRKIQEEQELTV